MRIENFNIMFQSIDKLVQKKIRNLSIEKSAQSGHVCFIAKNILDSDSSPFSFSKGILSVQVKDNIAAQEIKFRERQIIERINAKIGQELVRRISFRVL